jgi:signal transduction histidine kinase
MDMKTRTQSPLDHATTTGQLEKPVPAGRFVHSLQFKGYLFIVLLLSYMVFIAIFVLGQRHQPLEQLEQYQKIQKAQEALVQADLAAFHIVTVLFSDVSQSDLQGVVHYFSSLRQQYINLQQWFPEQAESFRNLVEAIPAMMEEPSEQNLQRIHFHLAKSKMELDRLMSLNRGRLTRLIEDYRAHNDSIVVTTLILGIMGMALLGAITILFFNQLKSNLYALQKRTAEIVDGYRGAPLPVKQQDEVGMLIHGVNYMANALAEREQALEIQRSKTAFMEKMVAIDSLAGGIAHEIGNPVTCIAGLMEEIKEDEDNQLSKNSQQSLAIIKEYIDGLVKITHDLSVIDTHKSDKYEWLDINQLIANTCNIFHYDKRWSSICINMNPDYTIPAVFASRNQLTQLISNVLENAMDAVQLNTLPVVTIHTQLQDEQHLLIRITDNGTGMNKAILEHIFDPFYSTKPVGQGTGLGLAICWTITKTHHGSIKATSVIYQGSEISIILPINQPGNTE